VSALFAQDGRISDGRDITRIRWRVTLEDRKMTARRLRVFRRSDGWMDMVRILEIAPRTISPERAG
jgi:hypothetical protein